MPDWLLNTFILAVNTLLIALPLLAPLLVLLIARRRGLRWPAQKKLLWASLGFWMLSLAIFAAEAFVQGAPQVFFKAFYGEFEELSTLVFCGYAAQLLALIALLLVVNWKTILLYRGIDDGDPRTAALAAKLRAVREKKAAKAAEARRAEKDASGKA